MANINQDEVEDIKKDEMAHVNQDKNLNLKLNCARCSYVEDEMDDEHKLGRGGERLICYKFRQDAN